MLPRGARVRLARPLREAINVQHMVRDSHTIPLDADLWDTYSEALLADLRALAELLENLPLDASFSDLSEHVQSVLTARQRVLSILLALEPFQPFDTDHASAVFRAIDAAIGATIDALEEGNQPPPPSPLLRLERDWPRGTPVVAEHTLRQVFGLDEEPVDEIGELKPGLVLAAYKYDGSRLLRQLAPHLMALGLPLTRDVLAMTAAIGWVADAPDPVLAYVSMDLLTRRLLAAPPELTAQVAAYFRERERGSQQARRRVLRTIAGAAQANEEARALAAVEVYRRLVEGPVRQFGWVVRCLDVGTWSPPPTLTRVRDAMVALGGVPQRIAERAVLVDMRNGEAHEDLEWDGIRDQYVVKGQAIGRDMVGVACLSALSFDRGCEAALACHRAAMAPPVREAVAPSPDDPFSMPVWQRAEAFFGSNGLRALRTEFNGRTARVWLKHLEREEVNPCLQALMSVWRLLPEVEVFEVYVQGLDSCRMRVPAVALEHTLPVWTKALETFDRMPTATFLPANFASRRDVESEATAARSAAWISVDGVLDAIDGGPASLEDGDVRLLVDRLALVRVALEQCLHLVPEKAQTRPIAVLMAVRALIDELGRLPGRPLPVKAIEASQHVQHIRYFWSTWGPVSRHPNVPEPPPPPFVLEAQPRRPDTHVRLYL